MTKKEKAEKQLYTSITIDTSGNKWEFLRFRQIGLGLAVCGTVVCLLAALFFILYLAYAGSQIYVGTLIFYTLLLGGTGASFLGTYYCSKRLDTTQPMLQKYSGLYLLCISVDAFLALFLFSYSLTVLTTLNLSIPLTYGYTRHVKPIPILAIIFSIPSMAISFYGLYGSCCRYPVKRIMSAPAAVVKVEPMTGGGNTAAESV